MSKILRLMLLVTVSFACVYGQTTDSGEAKPKTAVAESPQETALPDLEFQIYLLVGSNTPKENNKPPAILESVVSEMRNSLALKHFALQGTTITRTPALRGSFHSKWNTPPLFGLEKQDTAFEVNAVEINQLGGSIKVRSFALDGKVAATVAGVNGQTITEYRRVTINTGFTLKEGEPAVVGTLNVGSKDEVGVVVVMARRTKYK